MARHSDEARGTLLIIGGHEDKEGDRLILRYVAAHVGSGKLVVVTVASAEADELWETYEHVFHELGVRHVYRLHVESRGEALEERHSRVLDGAAAVFMTGGDQLRLTSRLGDTPIYRRLHELYARGALIAGTSAGASAMCETMLVGGVSYDSPRIGEAVRMAPGLGFLSGVIIDQHFGERGRIGRLVGAVAHNPRILGIGIDENTAIVCGQDRRFRVIGEGGVYVVDGESLTHTNLAEEEEDRTLSVFGVRLHLLSMGDTFEFAAREPRPGPAAEVERELLGRITKRETREAKVGAGD